MGLVVALPLSALAIVLYPFVTRAAPREDIGDVPPRTWQTVLFGVALGLLVTLTSVGAGAIGVTVLAALYPVLPAKRLVGSDITHAMPLTLVGGLGHLGLGNVDASLLLALLRVDPRNPHRRAPCRRGAGAAAPADSRCATRPTRSTRSED
jgi:uncharacterized membrane protein YfcA